jgi:hypothetical protein
MLKNQAFQSKNFATKHRIKTAEPKQYLLLPAHLGKLKNPIMYVQFMELNF